MSGSSLPQTPKPLRRRQRQRLENPHRADEMHAAMLAARRKGMVSAQADDPEQIGGIFTDRLQLFVGCSGWYYRHWHRLFYPESIPDRQWFAYYSSQFRTVELNAPFYSWPKVATVKSWLRQARDKPFVYTVKVNELITHSRRFLRTRRYIRDFGYIADLLGPRMGCFLFQLPPSAVYSAAALKRIVSQLDPQRRNVVEFRHPSWWNERVYAAFREAGIIFCASSGPKLPGDLIQTADDVYVRFHGLTAWYRHDYSHAELAEWAKRMRECGAKRVWAYFNNDHDAHAIKNARTLIEMLRQ